MKGVFEPNSIIQKGFSGRKILKKTAYTLRVTPFYTIVWYHVTYPYLGTTLQRLAFVLVGRGGEEGEGEGAVSYTHLTLPTKLEV